MVFYHFLRQTRGHPDTACCSEIRCTQSAPHRILPWLPQLSCLLYAYSKVVREKPLHTFTFSILDVCKPGQPDRIRRHPSISASTCLLSWPTLGKLGHVLLRYHYHRNIGAMSPDTKQTPTSEQRHSRMLCALMLGRACRAPVLPKVPRSIFI